MEKRFRLVLENDPVSIWTFLTCFQHAWPAHLAPSRWIIKILFVSSNLLGLRVYVFWSQIRLISFWEDMSDDKIKAAEQPGKNLKLDLQELSLDDDTNSSKTLLSTPSSPTSKKSSAKKSCLCAPTTHPGSFRCRKHRNSASVGANLSELGNRRTASVGANLYQLGNNDTTKPPKRSREC